MIMLNRVGIAPDIVLINFFNMLPTEQESNHNNKSTSTIDPVQNTESAGSSSSNISGTAPPRTTAETHKSWSSTLLTLLSGSRSSQETIDANKDDEKIDEELTW